MRQLTRSEFRHEATESHPTELPPWMSARGPHLRILSLDKLESEERKSESQRSQDR